VGVIVLQLAGNTKEQDKLESALNAIRGLEVQRMKFDI
jgi:hypothetical protein